MSVPRISVLIATADRETLLAGCLESLAATRFAAAEILVLDQGREAAEPPRAGGGPAVRRLRCPRRGKSAALNLGVRAARAAWLAFTDDDCLVAPDWLEVIDRAARAGGDRFALTGRVVPGPREGEAVVAPSLREDGRAATYTAPTFRDVLFGNNMAIPAAVLRTAGPFDETLGPGTAAHAAEDNDLGYRLLRAGVAVRYLPEMLVTHRSWRRGPDQVRLFRNYGVGQGAFYGKHVRRGDLHMAARLARNLWDTGRDLGGAVLLGRGQDARASGAFARGLVEGFVRGVRGRDGAAPGVPGPAESS